ncbi:MAG: bifunctional folylpolyglutamate synthase/dihydrofolate synthase [Bacteroidales bacterium]|nr:bifunctional folylpolyglutamate synthase/dihydrofolate synthase [Bacteroidales bacterium]
MYQRIGKAAYKADLNVTIELLNILDNPQNKFKSIHIAGTNGKGSVAHLIASVLQSAGLKTGLYTSPHLKDFRERIKINGRMIEEDFVIDFVEKNKSNFKKIQPSFFEMTVGMAFQYFTFEKVDIAVVEVGMGGRLDSTNIIKPELSVITNIGLDHTQFLGDTIEKIAKEKAEIIKPETPVVIGETQSQIKNIFTEKAKENNCKIYFADEHFKLKKVQTPNSDLNVFDAWKDNEIFIEKLSNPLLGEYQTNNLTTCLQALDLLNNKFELNNNNIRDGIENVITNTGIIGRWQKLNNNPLIICDTGHNIDGIKSIVSQISNLNFNKLHFVFGVVNDKNIDSILQILPQNAVYYFCKADIPRGLDQEELENTAFKYGLNGKSYSSVRKAFESATNNAGINDLVFVGGSTFVVAEVV